MRFAASVFLAAAIVSLAADGVAREATQRGLRLAAETTVVRVPVYVTDREGRAVGGLTVADFEVREDGRKRKVVGFREIDGETHGVEIEGPEALLARRQFMLLFDLSFSSVRGLLRAREAAQEFVGTRLAPVDLAAVGTFSLTAGVKLLVGFTSDKPQLKRAIDSLGLVHAERRVDPLGLAFDVGDSSGAGGADDAGIGQMLAEEIRSQQVQFRRSQEAQYRQGVGGLLAGLSGLAGILDSVQGRKQLIYFSAGFDDSVLLGAEGELARESREAVIAGRLWEVDSESFFGDAEIRDDIQRMLRSLGAADVVVHTVDVTGLATDADASISGRGTRRGQGRESLALIAGASGGRFIRGANDLGTGLDDILESTRRYYLLAFEPGERSDVGQTHKIEVEVRGKGLRVSHRSTYRERPPYRLRSGMARRLQAAEAIAKGMSGGEIDLRLLALPYRTEAGVLTLSVVGHVPAPSLLGEEGRRTLNLDIYAYALDAEGSVEDDLAFQAKLDLARWGALLEARGLQLQTAFVVPPGTHSLRFLIRDGDTGRMGIRTLEVEVPSFDSGELVLYPPLFMQDPEEHLILNLPSRSLPTIELPFRISAEVFSPGLRPQLTSGEKQSICIMAFTGEQPEGAEPGFELKAQLLDTAGNAARVGRLRVARSVHEPDGFQRLVLDVTPAELTPGDYSFTVKVADPESGQAREASQAVRVN